MFEALRHIRPVAVGAGDVGIGIAPQSQIDFSRIRTAIWRGKGTIVAATLAALALAVLFVLLAPRQYTATTQIIIDPTDLRAVGSETTQPNQMSDAALMQVESQVQVLSSDAVLRRVVNWENLDHDPEFVRGPSLLSQLMGKDALPADTALAALNELKRRVQVKRAERTLVVDVSVTSRDPDKAARIANAIAQAYLQEQTQVRADAARQVSQSLSSHLKELQDQVREAEEKIEAFKARNNIVNANGQLVGDQQLTDMSSQLGSARLGSARRAPAPPRPRRGSIRSSWCSARGTRAALSRRPCNRQPSRHCAANIPRCCGAKPSRQPHSARAIRR
jgi:succinoglycan biosynthesis transport protein ExoP